MDKVQMLQVLAASLFALGLMGVIIRRNVLVMLMCMELMLNGVNLSLVIFAHTLGSTVGAGARVPGLRGGHGRDRHRHPDRAAARAPQAHPRPRVLLGPEGLTGPWDSSPLIVVLPLLGFVLNGLARQPPGQALRHRGGLRAARDRLRRHGQVLPRPARRRLGADLARWPTSGRHGRAGQLRDRVLVRPAHRRDGADRDRRGLAHPRLLHRLHARGQERTRATSRT